LAKSKPPLMIKNPQQIGFRRNISEHNKGHFYKFMAIILTAEGLKALPSGSRTG